MIANCGHDERGRYLYGAAGDQTETEWQIIPWYSSPWNLVLRHPDPKVRERIALNAEHAAGNDHIGYDQAERESFWYQLANNTDTGDPAEIHEYCEADCSSGVAACSKIAGWQLEREGYSDADVIEKLKAIPTWTSTYSERANFRNAGFVELEDAMYLWSDKYLLRGDILVNEQMHTTINLTDGDLADASGWGGSSDAYDPFAYSEHNHEGQCELARDRMKYFGWNSMEPDGIAGKDTQAQVVALIQQSLNWDYPDDPPYLDVDGVLGEQTAACMDAHPVKAGDGDWRALSVKYALWFNGWTPDLSNWDFTDADANMLATHAGYHGVRTDGVCDAAVLKSLLPSACA